MADHLRVRVTLENGTALEFNVHLNGSAEVLDELSKEGYRDEATGILYPADSIREIEVWNAEDGIGPLPDPFSIN